jgi:hypothetical protein
MSYAGNSVSHSGLKPRPFVRVGPFNNSTFLQTMGELDLSEPLPFWPVMVSRLALPLTRQPVLAAKGVCCVWCVVFVVSFVASSDYGCRWTVVGGLFVWLPFIPHTDQYHSCSLRQPNTTLSLN